MKRIYLLFCLLQFGVIAFSQSDPTALFNQANEMYKAKKYSEAIQQYETIKKSGFNSTELYYNLGNSYYRNGEIGAAILNFERALMLAPGNKDVLHNLGLARELQKNDLSEIPEFFGSRWWKGLLSFASSGTWGVIGLLLLWLGIGGFVLWLLGKERAVKKKGFLIGTSFLILCILPFICALGKKQLEKDSGVAILLEKEISFRTAPDEESEELILLHEGAKLNIIDQIGEWYKVRLINGEQGWLPASSLEKI